jgi:hypothetical protein
MDIESTLVPIKQAKELWELGFRGKCVGNQYYKFTYQQALTFLRKKGLYCWVQPRFTPHGEPRVGQWVINIYKGKGSEGSYVYDLNKVYKSETQAQLACIRECIKLLK